MYGLALESSEVRVFLALHCLRVRLNMPPMKEKVWRVAGINFDHFHMGDLLREVFDHPLAEIVGISDEQPERMEDAQQNFSLDASKVFTDYRACLESTKPDLVILCPSTKGHAEWVEKVAS